ncbi:MAG: type II toxin-antitoxin system VapC family toxin, partial [Bacteroidota bacterium]|nr:type II toxin-antitoxin system VapC family toxin [Bacteroidota bacterium]
MKIFFDTSSLFKLYHTEEGTQELIYFFKTNSIDKIFLAEITRIEFCSAVWKKCRKNEIQEETAKT